MVELCASENSRLFKCTAYLQTLEVARFLLGEWGHRRGGRVRPSFPHGQSHLWFREGERGRVNHVYSAVYPFLRCIHFQVPCVFLPIFINYLVVDQVTKNIRGALYCTVARGQLQYLQYLLAEYFPKLPTKYSP